MTVPYRLGIDIGTNSLGWCALDLDHENEPRGIRRIGVRIFSDGRDPQSGASLAVDRRDARSARRRRDRFVRRRDQLMKALVRHGLMPNDAQDRKVLESLDPYELRAKGLDTLLPPHHFGRALFHINQRRGFKSNRKTDKKQKGDDIKGMKGGIGKLRDAIAASGARTLGEYLYTAFRKGRKVRERLTVRARPHVVKNKNEYDLYADRAMYEEEFKTLWQRQIEIGANLSEEARAEISRIIFHQRPLKPVQPGKCALDPSDERAPLALPLVQRFRMLSELANLEIVFPDQSHKPLTLEERDKILAELERKKEMSFDRMRAKLALDSEVKFNLEDEKRKGLKGDATGAGEPKKEGLAYKEYFGPAWWSLSLERRDAIVEALLSEEKEDALIDKAVAEWGLTREAAANVSDVSLPDGYGRLGRRALREIVHIMEKEMVRYKEAISRAGYVEGPTGEVFGPPLPYYGKALEHIVRGTGEAADDDEIRYGRLPNPTVHVAMNELRKVVNALSERYGPPKEIVVEIARDLPLGQKAKQEKVKEQADNQKKNDERREKLRELGQSDNAENLLRMRLWEELGQDPMDRRCVYTGEQISITRLFSPQVEIEHILPFKRTLDNSPANKTVSLREANRVKGNRSPHEAFHASADGFDWDAIMLRATSLPKNKSWRFGADAMDKFEGTGDFLARQLVDTQYISKLAREYLTKIAGPYKVWVVTGRLTQMLRGKWGLNSLLSDHNQKNRFDHRHHAIDAFVVGCTDRAMLQRVASAADQMRERLIDDMPDPWEGYRDELKQRIGKIVVSHKPDHGVQGQLHNDTAYGIVERTEKAGVCRVVHRVALSSFTKHEELEAIRDPYIRNILKEAVRGVTGKDFPAALVTAGAAVHPHPPVRRVRVIEALSVIPISNSSGTVYKAYKGDSNYCYDIFAGEKGRWGGEIISRFDANHPSFDPRAKTSRTGAPLIMRLHVGDLLAIEDDGTKRVMRVVKLSKGQIVLAEHFEGGPLKKRDSDKEDRFKYRTLAPSGLQKLAARYLHVDVDGRVHDPGFLA